MTSNHHGVVYTKRWVVDLILDVAGYVVDRPLFSQCICEPSCGEGAFLLPITDRLVSASKAAHRPFESLTDCVCAYDTDGGSVARSRERVRERLIQLGCREEVAKALSESWIKEADFVLEPMRSFDYVVGNPPYVRAVEIDAGAREEYCRVVSSMTKGCDLFIAFIQKGVDQLPEGGSLTFICADRWLQNQYGRLLRRHLVENDFSIDCLIRMHGVDAFDAEVDAYPAITRISKNGGDLLYVDCDQSFCEDNVYDLRKWLDFPSEEVDGSFFSAAVMDQMKDDSIMPLSKPSRVRVIRDLIDRFPSLEDSGVTLGIGIATGNDGVFIVDDPDIVEGERLLPVFSMRDHRRHLTKEKWLVNPWTNNNELIDLEDYPKTKSYFENHRETLSKRHVARKGAWYRTIDKPKWSLMGKPMLLFPDLATTSDPVFSAGDKYPCHNCYWLISDKWDLPVLGGLLMSDIAESFIEALCVKMRGGTLRFQAQYLRLIHVPAFDSIGEELRVRLADSFWSRDREAASAVARVVYGLGG